MRGRRRAADWDRAAPWLAAGVALVPSVAGFVVLATLRPLRWLGFRDAAWLGAAALIGIVDAARGDVPDLGLLVALAWLVAKGSEGAARRLQGATGTRSALVAGLAVGAGLSVAVGLMQVTVGGAARAWGPSLAGDPNLYAHALIAIVGGASLAVRNPTLKGVLGALLVVGVVAAGSRAALLAVLVLVVLFVTTRRLAAIAVGAGVAAVLGGALILAAGPNQALSARFLNAFDLLQQAGGAIPKVGEERNLLRASEMLHDSNAWDPLGVRLIGPEPGTQPARYELVKSGPEPFNRLQQRVRLEPSEARWFRMELRAAEGGRPGLLAWGKDSAGASQVAEVALVGDALQTRVSGTLVVLSASLAATSDGWQALTVGLRNEAGGTSLLSLGPAPDLRAGHVGSVLQVRALSLTAVPVNGYDPTYGMKVAQGSALARIDIWRVAWLGFLSSPWSGHGNESFAESYAALQSSIAAPASHAHNLVLQVLFAYGGIGLLALVGLLASWFGRAARARTIGATAVLISLLTANLFDATLLSSLVLYPTAILLGAAEGASQEP